MQLDLTWSATFTGVVVLYYIFLYLFSLKPLPPAERVEGRRNPLFVMFVPARNEQTVIGETLLKLNEMNYDGEYRILCINDASTDLTKEIVERFATNNSRVRILNRAVGVGGIGKSDALNDAYRQICEMVNAGDPWLAGYSSSEIVIGILDADGWLECNALTCVSPYFNDPNVGSTQVGVRIYNANVNALARMQDIEFVGFTFLVQIARDKWGASGLGGNGQFTRLNALQTLGANPWHLRALTEDLDLGLRLVCAGWRTRFCQYTQVAQQGLTEWPPLLKQRTRWIQGHYQCWAHIPALLKARGARLSCRIDLILYLVLVVTVVFITSNMVLSILSALGVVEVTSSFLSFVPHGFPLRITSLMLSVAPLAIFMYAYQRNSKYPFMWWELPAYGFVFSSYSYVWIITTVWAWWRLITRKNTWVKTPRVAPVEKKVFDEISTSR